jgi:hypothetical protein
MFDRVTNPPSPADPGIAQFSVDPARANLVDIINTAQAAGQHFVRPDSATQRHTVVIDSAAGGNASFTDC